MLKIETGRIIKSLSGFYDVRTENKVITCRARGSMRRTGMSPQVGDIVDISVEKGKGMVEKIHPRKNCFVRPAVSNLDLLVVFAANVNPVTEPFLIDRVAAIAGDQEVPVCICVNKCDMDPGTDLAAIYRQAGYTVIQTSAETGMGIEELRAALGGKFCAFTGNSGVGKSSILNALDPELRLPVGEVSEKLGRGRHTTRHVELFEVSGGLIADTPGFSAFDTDRGEIREKEVLQHTFREFKPYLDQCRFIGCAHVKEKGCEIDYIHGDAITDELGSKPGNIGFKLPSMGKDQLFKTVIADGVLPRKTFSMGHAQEKRYYLEAREIK